MHRSALRLRSCCQPRLRWCLFNFHVRCLSSAGTVPVANTGKHTIETLEPWQDSSGKTLARREEDTKDIIVDDLSATLEAHRASNRAVTIRKLKLQSNHDSVESVSRPLLRTNGDGDSEAKKTQEGKEYEVHQMWPADSVQAKERYGKTGSRGFVKSTDPLEYTGVVQWPKQPWRASDSSKNMPMQRPWLAYLDTTNEDYHERLTNEIKAYEAYMRLSPQEEAASRLVVSDVNSVAQNEPEIKPLTLLGSRSTGLATPISDFDFTFTLPNSLPGGWILPPSEADLSQAQFLNHGNKLKAVKALKKVDRHFRSSAKFSNIDFVRHARVPIIRSKHVATGLDVQIQTMAPYQAAQEYTIAYLSEFPSLRPLYIILRYCLEVRNLTTVFEGGLGSYSILMMIVTALKHSSGKFASDDIAGQLLHVLEFYGKADLYKVGFSANPPRLFEKQKKGWSLEERTARMADSQLSGIDKMQTYYPRKPYLLCLQDPANDLNDLGKNAYAIKHIQATFNKARESIQVALEQMNEKSDDMAQGGSWSCLGSLVRADYRQFELRRNRVEQCADPLKLNDQDYLKETTRKDFKERMKQYTGVAEEDDIFPETAVQAIDGNAAESLEVGDGLSDGTRHLWYRKRLARNQERTARTKRRRARTKAIMAEKIEQLQRLHGTNDDEYGWKPSSSSNQKTLLQAIAAPKLALAARISPSKRIHHAQTQKQDMDKQMTETPTPDVSSTPGQQPNLDAPRQIKVQEQAVSFPPPIAANCPETTPPKVVPKGELSTESPRKARSESSRERRLRRKKRLTRLQGVEDQKRDDRIPKTSKPGGNASRPSFRKQTVGLMETVRKVYPEDKERDGVIPKASEPGGKASPQRPKASKLVKKVYVNKFSMRRAMIPSSRRRSIAQRLKSDGAFLPERPRDKKESSAVG